MTWRMGNLDCRFHFILLSRCFEDFRAKVCEQESQIGAEVGWWPGALIICMVSEGQAARSLRGLMRHTACEWRHGSTSWMGDEQVTRGVVVGHGAADAKDTVRFTEWTPASLLLSDSRVAQEPRPMKNLLLQQMLFRN